MNKAGMDVALNKVGKLIFVHERQITKLLVRLALSAIDPWKLKPGFINRVLVEVIFEASKCL